MDTTKSRALFQDARSVIPGGVNSPVRAFRSVGGDPLFIQEAHGATIHDADGNAYLDFVGSWGPMLLGHDHPEIREAVAAALVHGASFGAPTPGEVELAHRVVDLVPSVEMVRLVNSGTEATMSALRLARAHTGRNGVIKFRGGYHGHGDAFLVEAGSGAATLGVPNSPGVTPGAAQDTRIAEYNDLDSVATLLADGQVAAVFVEPIAGNMGCVPPEDGFLEGLRRLCDESGALLVFDEVMTGFRVAPGGAQERYDVMPDLTTMGKVLGGGLPMGAFGGPEEIMRGVAPVGPVYQAGTLSGNPLATAAGNAMLGHLQAHPEVYERLEALGQILDEGFGALLDRHGVPVQWCRVGAMAGLAFTREPVRDWATASGADTARFGRFFHGMLSEGIYLAPSAYEALFFSTAHTESDMERLVEAAGRVLPQVFTEVSA